MKSIITLSLLALALSASAIAGEHTGTVSQALGEACFINASLGYANGGCGSAGDKYLAMDYGTDMYPGTLYGVTVQVVDQWNNATTTYDQTYSYGVYTQYRSSDAQYTPTNASGIFQARLTITDANTGVAICTAQSQIIQGF